VKFKELTQRQIQCRGQAAYLAILPETRQGIDQQIEHLDSDQLPTDAA
jgi:hypothetical protein